MGSTFKSEYYSEGKPYHPKKKNGVYNSFKYIQYPFLKFENDLNHIVKFLEDNGVKDIAKRDAYEMIYKFFTMKELANA